MTETTQPRALETSSELGELALALAKAQPEYTPIVKDKTGKVQGKTKEGKYYEYTFKYADIADVLKATQPALSKYELAFVQLVEGATLVSVLLHSSGQRLVSNTILTYAAADPQAAGKELTYRRRHAASAILGVASDDDDPDAMRESGEQGARSGASPNAVRQPARRSQQAQPEQSDTGELASESERNYLRNRAGDDLAGLLTRVGATSLDSLTKDQFAKARRQLVTA